jgi:hypothetical protein
MGIRTAFDKDAHHLHVRVQGGTHERGVTRFIARVCIRSPSKQVPHLRCVAGADGVKERLVEGALVGPIFRPRRVMRAGRSRSGESPSGDQRDNENE